VPVGAVSSAAADLLQLAQQGLVREVHALLEQLEPRGRLVRVRARARARVRARVRVRVRVRVRGRARARAGAGARLRVRVRLRVSSLSREVAS